MSVDAEAETATDASAADTDPEATATDGETSAGDPGGVDASPAGGEGDLTGEVTRRPTLLSRRLSVVTALTVTLLAGLYSVAAMVAGAVAVAALWGATLNGNRRLVDIGGGLLLLQTTVAGLVAPELVTLACTVGTVVAWDVATNAIEMGEQMGREPDTGRAELAHALATVGVGTLFAGVAYGIYVATGAGQPAGAVIALLVGAIALLSALRL